MLDTGHVLSSKRENLLAWPGGNLLTFSLFNHSGPSIYDVFLAGIIVSVFRKLCSAKRCGKFGIMDHNLVRRQFAVRA